MENFLKLNDNNKAWIIFYVCYDGLDFHHLKIESANKQDTIILINIAKKIDN